MLRKEQRRHERRSILRRRLLAGSTAVVLALGMAAGGTAPAFSVPPSTGLPTPIVDAGGVTTYDQNGLVCSASSIGFQKPDDLDGNNLNSDGSYSAGWGTISWNSSTRMVSWTIVEGWDVDVCVKGGTVLSLLDTSETSSTSYTHTYAGLSHLGFRINASTPGNDLDCLTATNTQGRALTNGDHITMDIVQNGTTFQINAHIDIRQSSDPESESGLVVRVTAPGGPYTLPLSNTERDSGVFSFSYSPYLTGQWTVEWVQFTSTYFNQSRDSAQFLVCGDPPSEIAVEPAAVKGTCATGGASITLPPVDGVLWFINGVATPASLTPIDVLAAGDYTVTAQVDPEAQGGPYVFAEGFVPSWPFVFTQDDLCELAQETFTDASIGFIDPTCDRGQQLDPTQLAAADDTLAELESYEQFTDGSYEVVFVTTAADARFVEPLTPTPGRTVSSDGTMLTFTGQLLGPDLSGDCLPTLPLTEGSVTFMPATCLDATNWLVLPNTEGVQWWIDGEPATAGTWPMSAGDVLVEATPQEGFGFGPEAETEWEYAFPTAEEACELSSLAQTGASNALVGVGFAAVLIMMAGFGIVIGRRFQQA